MASDQKKGSLHELSNNQPLTHLYVNSKVMENVTKCFAMD